MRGKKNKIRVKESRSRCLKSRAYAFCHIRVVIDDDKMSTIIGHVLYVVGFHPMFNRTFNFDIAVPELAVVEFQVMDYESMSSNVLVAQCCLPFTSIMPGIFLRCYSVYKELFYLYIYVVTQYTCSEKSA